MEHLPEQVKDPEEQVKSSYVQQYKDQLVKQEREIYKSVDEAFEDVRREKQRS